MRVDRRIRFKYATYGRRNFLIRKEKVADSKNIRIHVDVALDVNLY